MSDNEKELLECLRNLVVAMGKLEYTAGNKQQVNKCWLDGFKLINKIDNEASRPVKPIPDSREPACIERWPESESGCFDCCRWPKSCSCA